MTKHQRAHTEEKPYHCSHCDKCFALPGDLIGHQRIHTGKETYECSQCDESFIMKSHLVIHQRRHTGEKKLMNSGIVLKVLLK